MTDHDKPMLKDPDPDGNHTPEHVTDGGPCWCGPSIEYVPAADSVRAVNASITDVTSYSEDTLFKVLAVLKETGHTELDASNVINAMLNAGLLFREPAGDYDSAEEKSINVEATMAAEPIELRLQRAWLNGFKEGVERSAYAATEVTGRWDY